MADDDKPPKRARLEDRDVRKFKTPPKGVADQIARPSGAYIPLEITDEDSKPTTSDPVSLLDWTASKVRTMSSELHQATVETATIKTELNTLKVEQKTTGEKVDEIGSKVDQNSGKLDTLNTFVMKALDASNDERKTSAARDHEWRMKILVAILVPLATAAIAYFLTR